MIDRYLPWTANFLGNVPKFNVVAIISSFTYLRDRIAGKPAVMYGTHI